MLMFPLTGKLSGMQFSCGKRAGNLLKETSMFYLLKAVKQALSFNGVYKTSGKVHSNLVQTSFRDV
jgi:hypothetical protein